MLPSAAEMPPCAATVCERVGKTLVRQAACRPFAASPNVARKPAPPAPPTMTSYLCCWLLYASISGPYWFRISPSGTIRNAPSPVHARTRLRRIMRGAAPASRARRPASRTLNAFRVFLSQGDAHDRQHAGQSADDAKEFHRDLGRHLEPARVHVVLDHDLQAQLRVPERGDHERGEPHGGKRMRDDGTGARV